MSKICCKYLVFVNKLQDGEPIQRQALQEEDELSKLPGYCEEERQQEHRHQVDFLKR